MVKIHRRKKKEEDLNNRNSRCYMVDMDMVVVVVDKGCNKMRKKKIGRAHV